MPRTAAIVERERGMHHADDALAAAIRAGSPFAAGGAGTGTGIGSQGPLQVSSDGKYLLAVDAGSNEISVLRINSDGELRPSGAARCPRAVSSPSASPCMEGWSFSSVPDATTKRRRAR
jgi:hypothetical protein